MADAGSTANKDAAEQLKDLGRAALKEGDLEGALRRLSKSLRLYPDPETQTLLDRVNKELHGSKDQSSGEERNGDASSFPRESSRTEGAASSSFRHRRANGTFPSSSSEGDVTATQEQVTLVRRILRSSGDFYEVLELTKTCTEDEVKKSYRKLSLRVHPDKNKAQGAEEAFKVVSRAFKCLSDPQLRANYDRYGHEDPAQSRLQQHRARQQYAGDHPFAGHPFVQDDFDPNDIFNTFFGVHAMNGRVFVNRGGFPSHRRPAQRRAAAEDDQGGGGNQFLGLLQLLPVLLFLFYFIGLSSDPVYKHQPVPPYTIEVRTERWKVPYYVKSQDDFSTSHPAGSNSRWRIERQIEGEYRESLESHCYHEKLQRAQVYRWGGPDQAKKYNMPHCDELSRLVS